MNCYKTLEDLLYNVLTYNNILDIIDKEKDYNIKGNIYEKLFKICFLLNVFDNYNLIDKDYKEINNKNKYLEENKILNSCEDGLIDIKLKHKNKDRYIFFSCKYFNKEKDLNNYDISEIKTYLDDLKLYNDKYIIGLIIKNKEEFIKKYNNSKNNTLKKIINIDYIFDINDLKEWLEYINKNFSFEWLKNKNKQNFKLYDYQINLINKIDNNKNILLGACPRTGKTYIIAGYINKNKDKLKDILIITPCPKETLEQWNEIYDNYYEFDSFNILKIETSKELKNIKLKDKNIIIISKQLLQINYKEFDYEPNLLIFDEHDFHGTSELSKDIIKKYSIKSQNIYLTGTYYKSLYNIKNPTVILYNYYDLHKDNPKTPEQIYLTSRFNKDIYKEIKLNNLEFNFNLLFSLNNKNNFEYEQDIKYFIHYYITNDIINRIKKIYDIYEQEDNKYTHLWFLPENNIDLISKNLVKILVKNNYYRNFDILTFNSKNYYLYEIEYDNIKEDYKTNEIKLSKNINIKDFIKKQEKKIKINSNKFGLLILVGGMLQRGISLSHINTIFFLNESESYAKYLQSTYRCLTEEKNKKVGIIIDFNINRILSLFINYNDKDENINKLNIDDKIKYMIDNNMINLDIDKLINEDINNKMVKIDENLKTFKFDGQKSLQNILDKWNENPINQLNIFKKLIEDTYENLNLNINFDFLKTLKNIDDKEIKKINKEMNNKYELVNDENIDKQIINKTSINKKDKIKINEKEIKNIKNELIEKKKLTKDILPYIIPLSCILTYDNNDKEFKEILKYIKNNDTLKEIFNNQCETIWEQKELLNNFIEIIENLDNLENINNYISKIKYNINKLIDNIEELNNFINECLVIKSCEREKNGEVLTPSWLINEMLDKLDENYKKENNKSIFEEKLKWFDHSCGNGRFMIELFKRLKKYKHTKEEILNEMLYMSEYNKKNIFLLKLIFGKNSNINEGDTLKLDIKKKWNIDKFDVILGNPPYNSGGIKTWKGDKLSKTEKNITIWPSFIDFSINNLKNNGWLISINPLTWIKLSSNNHYLTKYKIKYLELWDASYSKEKINAEIPLSWFIINKSENKEKEKTIIKSNDKRHNIYNKEEYYIKENMNLTFCYFSIFEKLYNFTEKIGKFDLKNKKIKGNGNKIKLNDIIDKSNYGVDTYILNEGIMMKKINKKDIIEEHKNKKIIFANKTNLKYCYIDNIGYNICGNDNYYIIDNNENNLKLLYNYFNTKLINFIVLNTKYRGQFIEKFIFDYIPDIRNINNLSNFNDLYKLIGFTNNEINIINQF